MAVNYLADMQCRDGLDRSVVEASLTEWLSEFSAPLASGQFGSTRVDYRTTVGDTPTFVARLLMQDEDSHEDWRIHIELSATSRHARIERLATSPDEVNPDNLAVPDFVHAWRGTDPAPAGPKVLVAVDEPPSRQQLLLSAEVARFSVGMADVVLVSPSDAAAAAVRARLSCDGRPGSVVCVMTVDAAPIVVPATVALRDPVAAGRRVQRALVSSVTLAMGEEWLAAEAMLQADQGVGVDSVLSELAHAESAWLLERQTLLVEVQRLQAVETNLTLELAEELEELDQLHTKIRLFEREFARLRAYPIADVEDDELDSLPDTVAETIRLAQERLPYLLVTAEVSVAETLDRHEHSLVWARRLWGLMRGLNDYSKVVAEGAHRGGLIDYCRNPPAGLVPVSLKRVAMRESEPTMKDPACAAARVFEVPEYIAEDRQAVMFPHLKIANESPAPRAHFLDETRDWKKVVIGYVGPHLPTA